MDNIGGHFLGTTTQQVIADRQVKAILGGRRPFMAHSPDWAGGNAFDCE